MASLEDYYSDGVLKSLLAKNVNNSPVPVYPRSSADIIKYGDSNVEAKLDSLSNLITNLQTLTATISADITTINTEHYNKSYIDSMLIGIRSDITSIQEAVLSIHQTIDQYSFYTKDEIDTKINALNLTISNNFTNLDTKVTNLNGYLINNFFNKEEINSKVTTLQNNINAMKSTIESDLAARIVAFKTEVNDILITRLAEFYTKSEVDSKVANITNTISAVNTAVGNLKEETTSMNETSVNQINSHTDSANSTMLASIESAVSETEDTLNNKIDSQTSEIESLLQRVIGAINNVNSSVAAQISTLSGGGGTTYENGDEVAY